MFFDSLTALLRVLCVSLLAYGSLIALLRITGKRSLAKLNAFDFVVTVALGSTLATVLLSKGVALAEGVLAIAALLTLQWLVSRVSIANAAFRRLIRSEPRLLFEDGEFRAEAMAKERVTRSEVEAAIRKQGHGNFDRIAAVVLETDGSMSVIAGERAASMEALKSVTR